MTTGYMLDGRMEGLNKGPLGYLNTQSFRQNLCMVADADIGVLIGVGWVITGLAASPDQSSDDAAGISTFEGNQTTVSATHSEVVSTMQTRYQW
jgi:hypothetical protein